MKTMLALGCDFLTLSLCTPHGMMNDDDDGRCRSAHKRFTGAVSRNKRVKRLHDNKSSRVKKENEKKVETWPNQWIEKFTAGNGDGDGDNVPLCDKFRGVDP